MALTCDPLLRLPRAPARLLTIAPLCCSAVTDRRGIYLAPAEALAYYRAAGTPRVVREEKHNRRAYHRCRPGCIT
jgi:hypothetical protein